jgi:hypothetical protein
LENFQRMLRVQIVDTPFCSKTGGIRGFQSLDPSVNRTPVNQRAFSRNQPFVVAGIIPGKDVGRQERHDLLEPFEDLLCRVGFDRHVAFLVDEHRAMGCEYGANPVDRVGRLPERHAERKPGLRAFLGRLQEEIPGPLGG